MRTFHKSWQNRKSGWTRRIRWYQNEDGSSIRLKLETEHGIRNEFYDNTEHAQSDYQEFIERGPRE